MRRVLALFSALEGFLVLAVFSTATVGFTPMVFAGSTIYATEHEAVKAAADIYNPLSIREDREYMGAIYQTEFGFCYTVTAGSKRSDTVKISIPRGDIDSIVAFWHTHGNANPAHRYFSDTDTETVHKFGRPLYLADYTGYLKVFEPGDRTLSPYSASRLGLPRQSGFSSGKVVKDANGRAIRVQTKVNTLFS